MRSHGALILSKSCSSRPYASFEWMWTPITWFPGEISSPLTGGPSGGRDSEMRGNFALIMCTSCSPSPYASFGGCGLL